MVVVEPRRPARRSPLTDPSDARGTADWKQLTISESSSAHQLAGSRPLGKALIEQISRPGPNQRSERPAAAVAAAAAAAGAAGRGPWHRRRDAAGEQAISRLRRERKEREGRERTNIRRTDGRRRRQLAGLDSTTLGPGRGRRDDRATGVVVWQAGRPGSGQDGSHAGRPASRHPVLYGPSVGECCCCCCLASTHQQATARHRLPSSVVSVNGNRNYN